MGRFAGVPAPVWLTDCFEVVEMHVRPAAQGHGLGAAQLRLLLTMAVGRTTLLSTPEADEATSRAWRLYRRFGFVDVVRHFNFPGDLRPFAILGRALPLADAAGVREPALAPAGPAGPSRRSRTRWSAGRRARPSSS